MGTGPKIFLSVLGVMAVMILGVPIVAGLAKGGGASGGGSAAEPPKPYWNNQNIVGTTWIVKTERGDVTVAFQGGGIVHASHPLVLQFLNRPYLEGNWSISGNKLNVRADIPAPINQKLEFSATIEDRTIFGTGPEGERLEARQIN